MINEASSSKTPPKMPPPLPVEASTQLAPGFRFHPTDEELVSYYLKRKVTGKPIRVDAISEIDLYRIEPWDLPPRSRLRSRDLEWYFFTPLDRKYSNRCRTNRATVEGYWKTTGKDRPIQRRSRTIGVKKTLVYHAGRAPRGQRTNWVMHEYRLEDEDLTLSGILQDGYAVCRIFQKSGPGPQNGAQYGAPFIEAEWEMEEEEDDKLVPVNVNREDAPADTAGHDFVQLGDFFQNPGSGIQDLNAFISESRPVEHEFDSQTEDSSILVDEIFKSLDSLDDMTQDADFSAPRVSKTTLNSLGEREGPEDQPNCAAIQNNGYVQLEDIFVEGNTNSSSDIHSNHCLLQIGNNSSVVDDTCPSKILFQKPVEGDLGDTNCSTSELDQLQICPAVQHDMFPQPFDPLDAVFWDYPSGQLAEDNLIYYDALNHEDLYSEDGFTFETSLSPLAEFDFSEDLMAYYDAADDNLINASPNLLLSQFKQANSFEWVEPNDSPEVVGSSSSSDKEVFHENLVHRSSLGKPQTGDGPSSGLNYNLSDDKPKHCQDKTLTNRLASMLNSISAPPAFADEAALFGKTGRQIPATSGSALHLTASMIQIGNWTAMGESWTLQKHTELGFHLSYGLDGSLASKSVVREPRKTALSGLFPTFCWRGFHLCFLSAAILALSYKIGHSFCKM